MKMKIGIVGGSGNISTSIVRLLLAQGHEVVCFNRNQSPQADPAVRVVTCDRADTEAFQNAVQGERLDAGIDMICFNAEEARSSVCAFRGVQHFVQCSTVCTFGVQAERFPVPEDHPLRPISDYGRNKVAADAVFLEAWFSEQFPVTIIKPSTTFGPKMGMLRQIAWEFSWIDRVRRGKPIVVCGDGNAIHQFMHVDDAALAFAGVLGKSHCLGQTYNMVHQRFWTWREYHETAMGVLGREVELVGIPFRQLAAAGVPDFDVCASIFAHHCYFDGSRLMRDVPEFRPVISLADGLTRVVEAMDRAQRVPDSDQVRWEDDLIAKWQRL